jgi:ligand-binding sensor domain-containing protein
LSAGRTGAAAALALLLAMPVRALDPAKAITQYVHDVWQSEQGLPQNTVLSICQTRDGYLWLGTQEGLARFDGVRFTVFDKNNTPELKRNWVGTLFEDRAGNLWIGLQGGGLVRLQNGRFTAFTTKDGLTDDRVRALAEDRDGSLWIGTFGGLSRFQTGKFTTLTTRQDHASDQVVALAAGRDGSLWVGSFDGATAA